MKSQSEKEPNTSAQLAAAVHDWGQSITVAMPTSSIAEAQRTFAGLAAAMRSPGNQETLLAQSPLLASRGKSGLNNIAIAHNLNHILATMEEQSLDIQVKGAGCSASSSERSRSSRDKKASQMLRTVTQVKGLPMVGVYDDTLCALSIPQRSLSVQTIGSHPSDSTGKPGELPTSKNDGRKRKVLQSIEVEEERKKAIQPSENDVLLNPCYQSKQHAGNHKFSTLIQQVQVDQGPLKELPQDIIAYIHQRGGRFLELKNVHDSNSGWKVASSKNVQVVVLQTLRNVALHNQKCLFRREDEKHEHLLLDRTATSVDDNITTEKSTEKATILSRRRAKNSAERTPSIKVKQPQTHQLILHCNAESQIGRSKSKRGMVTHLGEGVVSPSVRQAKKQKRFDTTEVPQRCGTSGALPKTIKSTAAASAQCGTSSDPRTTISSATTAKPCAVQRTTKSSDLTTPKTWKPRIDCDEIVESEDDQLLLASIEARRKALFHLQCFNHELRNIMKMDAELARKCSFSAQQDRPESSSFETYKRSKNEKHRRDAFITHCTSSMGSKTALA